MSASFDSYKIFFYVGKYGNITHAASALFLSQSTVSRSIQNLEAELGCKLFERFQHGVILTAEGELLYNHISKACEEIFLGEEQIRQMQSSGGGSIRLGVNDFTFYQFVMPVLKEFHRDFPAYKVEITSQAYETQDSIFKALSSGMLDVACTTFPVPASGDFSIVNIAEYKDIMIAGNEFSELRTRTYSLSELRSYPFVSLIGGMSGNAYLEQAFNMHGLIVSPTFKVDTVSHFIPMVMQGLCLAVVPFPFYTRLKEKDKLFVVSVRESLPTRTVYVVTSKNHSHSAARDELIKRIRKYVQQHIHG